MTVTKPKKEKITKEMAKNLIEMLRQLMDAYGFFAESLGRIQKNHVETFDAMFSLEVAEKMPEILSQVISNAPKLGELYANIFIRMTTLLPKVRQLMDLSADEKMRLGKSLKRIAQDLEKLKGYVDELKEK